MMNDFLKVMLWGKEIGRLAWHAKRNLAYFTLDSIDIKALADLAEKIQSDREII